MLVTRDADFDTEPNNDLAAAAQDLTLSGTSLGAVKSSTTEADDDYYRIEVTAGDVLTVETRTPADGPFEFINHLDPAIELYAPTGALVADEGNSAPDGRNAQLTHTTDFTGTYSLRVMAARETSGFRADALFGQIGRGTLIGESDQVTLDVGDEVLISGTTAVDSRDAALLAIVDDWILKRRLRTD